MIIKYCDIEYLVHNENDLKSYYFKDCINFSIDVIHMLNYFDGLIFYR